MNYNKRVQVDYESEIEDAWKRGDYIRRVAADALPTVPRGLKLIPWECMMLARLNCVPGQVGELILAFPPGGSPAELIPHVHGGARIVTVLSGTGIFSCQREGRWIDTEITPGNQALFPRDVVHTFMGKDNMALLAHAVHAPYFPPEDSRAITYLDQTHTKHYPNWDPKEYFPEHLGAPDAPRRRSSHTRSQSHSRPWHPFNRSSPELPIPNVAGEIPVPD